MLDAYLAYRARLQPRALALVLPDARRTYAELNADVDRYAGGLAALGLAAETGLVALGPTTHLRRFVIMLALSRLAIGVTSPADPHADARLVIEEDWASRVEAAEPRPVAPMPRDPDAVGRVQLTSGSTQRPRRVGRTWRMLEARAHEAVALFAGGRGGTWILRTPYDTGLGHALASAAWMTGAAVAAEFRAASIPALIESFPPGLLAITPLQLRDLLAALPSGFRVEPRLQLLVTGGALSAAAAQLARLRLTPDVQIVYGASETGRVAVGPASRLETDPGWVGWPVPGVRLEVVGPDGAALPPGQTGELRVAGPASATRYLDDEESAADVFRDGFVYPGDLGRLTVDGGLILEGRLDERMNIGGLKVQPGLIEDAALELPGVRDVAAFTLPGPDGLDVCWLAVVADDGLSRETLAAHLEAHDLRLPAIRFAWADVIPRTASGKVDRQALKAQTLAALSPPP